MPSPATSSRYQVLIPEVTLTHPSFTLPPKTMLPPKTAMVVSCHGTSAFYEAIREGYLPPGVPVSISGRKKAWPLGELERINAARAAGASGDEIRALVKTIVAERAEGGVYE